MSTSIAARKRQPSIRRTLLTFSLLLVILPSLTFAITGGMLSYQSLLQSSRDQLVASADLKQRGIERWVEERESDLSVLAAEAALPQLLQTMHDSPEGSRTRLEAYSEAAVHLSSFLRKKVAFVELSLLDAQTGQTVVSTDAKREGQLHLEETYFREGQKGLYLQPPIFDPTINAPTILVARPVQDPTGKVLAVLVGRANLADLATLIQAETELGRTGETYLVTTERLYISGSRGPDTAPAGAINSDGIRAALSGKEGVGQYSNYRGEAVLGAYRWLPQIGVALLVEQSQADALASARRSALSLVAEIVVAAALASGATLLLTNRIVHPIVELTEVATQIAGGDLERTVPVRRPDEIGMSAQAFNSMTHQLHTLIGTLEQRVAERTAELAQRSEELEKLNRDLQLSSSRAERRAAQLAASAQVARAISQMRDLDQLLSQVTQLICDAFGYYHVGIFILDELGRFAVLRAASSEGGKQMLARNHKLAVGKQGIVGYVTSTGAPRIALDVGADAVHFDNPDLPQTRSEMALPLSVGGRTFGALDVQSTQEAAFTEEDVVVLSTLADQIAIAIENTHLFEQTQVALQEAEEAYKRYLHQEWEQLAPALKMTSFEYRVRGAPSGDSTAEPASLVWDLQPATHPPQSMTVPIRLRDQPIGAIDLCETETEREWTDDDKALVTAVADQVALALENVRLFEQARQRARREQLIARIAAKMRAVPDVESVLRTTVREIRHALGTSHGVIRLRTGEQLPTESIQE